MQSSSADAKAVKQPAALQADQHGEADDDPEPVGGLDPRLIGPDRPSRGLHQQRHFEGRDQQDQGREPDWGRCRAGRRCPALPAFLPQAHKTQATTEAEGGGADTAVVPEALRRRLKTLIQGQSRKGRLFGALALRRRSCASGEAASA